MTAHTSFPTEHLPRPLANFTRSVAESLCCPVEYVALPALAACASAIGTSRRIQARDDWCEPSVLWCVAIGRSGRLKSEPMDRALQPLRDAEGEAFREHAEEMKEHQREYAEWERERAEWKRPLTKTERANGDDRGDPPAKPEAPVCTRYTTADCTIEALSAILAGNRRGVLVARDELSGWLQSFNAYRAGKGGDEARWLELHRAGTLLIDRKTDGTIRIERAAVSVCGTIQPGTLERLLTREYIESGLAGRLLIAHPPMMQKRWVDKPIPENVKREYDRTLRGLLQLELNENEHGDPQPVDIPLSDESRGIFAEWYNAFAEQQASAESDGEAAALAKCEGAALRLALVHHLASFVSGNILENHITLASITAGIALAEWLAGQARRLYAAMDESHEARQQRELIEWIQGKGGSVSLREVYQRHNRFKTTADARAELDALHGAGIGEWHWIQHPKGGRPSECFRLLNGTTTTNTPVHDSANGSIGCGSGAKEPEGAWGAIE